MYGLLLIIMAPADVQAEAIDVQTEEIDVQAEAIDVQAEVIDVQAEAIDVQTEEIDVQAEVIDVQAEAIDVQTEEIDVQTEEIDVQTEEIDEQPTEIDVQAEAIDVQAEAIDEQAEESDVQVAESDVQVEESDVQRGRSSRLLVAAIDIGTTFSGWACSFSYDYNTDQNRVTCKHWNEGNNISLKAPTTVLIKPDGKTLEAFGYEAEDRYAELAKTGKHNVFYYFRRFKMCLHTKIKLTRNTTLTDDKGRRLPAMTVFSLAILYLKDDLMEELRTRMGSLRLTPSDIHWILTVPAIWNDSAKQFMREAALAAGISNDQLTIALEPEAASFHCGRLPITKKVKGTHVVAYQPGDKYMVIDAGGGTVDITVHEVLGGGRVRELYRASGGDWGGIKVDDCFEQFIMKLVGETAFRRFKQDCTEDYLELMRDFEVKKKTVSPPQTQSQEKGEASKEKRVILRVPMGLYATMEKNVAEGEFTDVSVMGGKLITEPDVFRSFFTEVIAKIVSHVRDLLAKPEVADVGAFMMVGGFSESPMLQHAIRSSFPDKTLDIPLDAGLAVLKGAISFGHDPSLVAERICKYTYGVRTSVPFIEGVHDPNKKIVQDGSVDCSDIFDKHVSIGQTVRFGEPQSVKNYVPATSKQTQIGFKLYATREPSPTYVTDPGMQKLGNVTVEVRDKSVARDCRLFTVSMTFSGTEIEMNAKETLTGKITTITADFLG